MPTKYYMYPQLKLEPVPYPLASFKRIHAQEMKEWSVLEQCYLDKGTMPHCLQCKKELGLCNPRQLCYKTHCPEETISISSAVVLAPTPPEKRRPTFYNYIEQQKKKVDTLSSNSGSGIQKPLYVIFILLHFDNTYRRRRTPRKGVRHVM
jgi:hypothetical protein